MPAARRAGGAVGAGAHRLLLRRGRVVGAGRVPSGSARRGRCRSRRRRWPWCASFADFVEREQRVPDRLADGALVDAIAAADLRGVGHRGDRTLAAMAAVAEIGGAEHQPLAHRRHVSAAARGGRTDFPPQRRNSVNVLRLKTKCDARLDGTDIAAQTPIEIVLMTSATFRLHPHSICLRRDSPRPRVDVGRMIARLLQ